MSYFTDVQEAAAQGQTVECALFALADFRDAPFRCWEGDIPISIQGATWHPMGAIAEIDGLEQSADGSAGRLTVRLSGLDSAIVGAAKASESDVEGRDFRVYMQFFSDGDPVGPFTQVGRWIMQRPQFAGNVRSRTLTMACETLFVHRARAPFALLTDADQRKRHPGDRGLEYVTTLVEKQVQWPRD